MNIKFLLCPICGERKKFKKNIYGNCSWSETAILNKHGDEEDYKDYDTGDSDRTDEDKPECPECNQEVLILDEKEYIKFIATHTKKDETWSKKKLKTNQRIKNELEAIMMVEKIATVEGD